MRKKPLPRYRVENLTRKDLERGALAATHRDYRGSGTLVLWKGDLEPIENLPDEELLARYVQGERRSLQSRARAQDLDLYELNPDDPSSSILFADSEILFRTRSGWNLGYIQPAGLDEVELAKVGRYAQVVAFLNRQAPAEEVVAVLRKPSSYAEWKRIEKQKRIVRDEDGAIVEIENPQRVPKPSRSDALRAKLGGFSRD
jgi:hypothetical protein